MNDFKWLDDGTGYTVLEERESEKEKADDNNAMTKKSTALKVTTLYFTMLTAQAVKYWLSLKNYCQRAQTSHLQSKAISGQKTVIG